MTRVKLTEAMRAVLLKLKGNSDGCTMRQLQVTHRTLKAMERAGLIELYCGEGINLAASIRDFQVAQAYALYAHITPAGRRAIAEQGD